MFTARENIVYGTISHCIQQEKPLFTAGEAIAGIAGFLPPVSTQSLSFIHFFQKIRENGDTAAQNAVHVGDCCTVIGHRDSLG